MDLGVLRDHIDDIDKQIIRLFEERMDVAEQVARYKIGCGKPVYDPVRERSKIERAKDMATTANNWQTTGTSNPGRYILSSG